MKLLKYNHPARTRVYDANKAYGLDELEASGLNRDQIKILFKPVNFEWEDIEVAEDEVEIEAEVEIEDIEDEEVEVEVKTWDRSLTDV